MQTAYPFRRTVLDGKFPRALYRHDLRQLFLYGLSSSIAAGVKDQSRSSDGDPTFSGSPAIGIGVHGRYVDFPTGAYHTCGSGFNTSNWSEGTFAIILNNQQLNVADPIMGDRQLTAGSNYTIDIEIAAASISFALWDGTARKAVGAGGLSTTGVWNLLVFDFGLAGQRIYENDQLLAMRPETIGTGTRASPASWMINRYENAPIVYGDKHVKLFAAWKRQVGLDVSRRLWRAYGRGA